MEARRVLEADLAEQYRLRSLAMRAAEEEFDYDRRGLDDAEQAIDIAFRYPISQINLRI